MWPVSNKPSALAGVAIQPENIHLVQLKKVRKGFLIERVRRYGLAADIFSAGKITAFDELQAKLADMVRTEGLRDMKTAVCVPSNQVKMHQMTVPAGLSAMDIEAEISAQVYRSLPAKADALAIDFKLKPAAQPEEVNVFFAAARREYVHRYQSCLQDAGLRVVTMDVDIFALLRAARYALRDLLVEHEKLGALYLGENYAVFAAQYDGEILFYQQWDGAGAARFAMERIQWVEWCCHTYQHLNIHCMAVGGLQELIYPAVKIISSKWECKVYEPDPFLSMLGASGVDKGVMNDSPSAFLLACGLAMREPKAW